MKTKATPIRTIKILADSINYYDEPRSSTVAKGTVLTFTDRIYVGGAYRYKIIVDNYITASKNLVKFTEK